MTDCKLCGVAITKQANNVWTADYPTPPWDKRVCQFSTAPKYVHQPVPEDPAERLREISRLWYAEINQGYAFLARTGNVMTMRALLDGYTHPDELPEE